MTYTPGDFFLWAGTDGVDGIIRIGTRSDWTHCGLFVPENGDGNNIIQAVHTGVERARFDDSNPDRFLVVDSGLDARGRELAAVLAESFIGDRYGFVTIVSYALSVVTRNAVFVGMDGTMTCSTMLAKCLSGGGKKLSLDPDRYRPVDIAAEYGISARRKVA